MKKSSLSEELIRESSVSSDKDLESHVDRIRKLMQREKSKLRQEIWVTVVLWVLVFVFIGLFHMKTSDQLFSPEAASHGNAPDMGALSLCLAMAASMLLFLAPISTWVLLWRLRGSSKKETHLRLTILEERLRDLEKNRKQN
jgi:hypothetical protein